MHTFIFQPGEWLGQGELSFNDSPEKLRFYMKWTIREMTDGVIYGEQRIEREGIEKDILLNLYRFTEITKEHFHVELESDILGSVACNGNILSESIRWEFINPVPFEGSEGFSGYEEYLFLGEERYLLKGKYSSGEHETQVSGKIWKKLEV